MSEPTGPTLIEDLRALSARWQELADRWLARDPESEAPSTLSTASEELISVVSRHL